MVGGVNAARRPDVNAIIALVRRMRELTAEFHDIKRYGHRDLSPDRNGNGIIKPFVKACQRSTLSHGGARAWPARGIYYGKNSYRYQ
ncbi:hypothetical protein [Pararhizobium sp. BT-229]|uniref:hypothetical protein n=1 Tax=Pararhizobium sp. BT-229 TaxID=2986923 RepID=UPI00299E4261|nr:hypothetical protein [Pararhizobium sp. BT-229]